MNRKWLGNFRHIQAHLPDAIASSQSSAVVATVPAMVVCVCVLVLGGPVLVLRFAATSVRKVPLGTFECFRNRFVFDCLRKSKGLIDAVSLPLQSFSGSQGGPSFVMFVCVRRSHPSAASVIDLPASFIACSCSFAIAVSMAMT